MHYYAYETAHAILAPWRLATRMLKSQLDHPLNPFANGLPARALSAACGVFEGLTRRYGKPEFAITSVDSGGQRIAVNERIAMRKTFCTLLHFERESGQPAAEELPRVLIVAPLSGHYATLLRGTIRSMMPGHDVYVTDWVDARDVPVAAGEFSLDDYIDYLLEFMRLLGPGTHVVAVCQPSVPALAATALLAADDDPAQPASLALIGGPIDTRRNPTVVNRLAEQRPLSWFEQNIISPVPFPNPGFMRPVYPGYLQLTGFMTMNLERHAVAHVKLFHHLVRGDRDSVRSHDAFYEEYMAVMDLPARFYLDTVEQVFQRHSLPEGEFEHRGRRVDCTAIRKTALITIEGERDDICGPGQTSAAHDLCPNIARADRYHYVQPGVGHYGVFNGSRWRAEVQPRLAEAIRRADIKHRLGARGATMPSPRSAVGAMAEWASAPPIAAP
ncbi:MAG: polyhydroxyalkanoate depolymerase [Hyphomicrobiaceae bacterium]|nr:polyhydroxyalkanoate depolymerase [Hyphomicrobiaceae bacterium]